MAKTVSVKVEQPNGEITVLHRGFESVTYEVQDHKVEVDPRHLSEFLAVNAGSKEVAETRRQAKEGE